MKLEPATCSGLILAGGRGTRLGNSDKGLVELQGNPLVQHVINHISSQVDDIVISANRNIDIYNQYSDKVIEDSLENFQGPLSGIASAMPHCRHEWVLVVACDIPFLPNDLVHRLSQIPADTTLSVASVEGHHQLVFLIHNSLLHSIQHSLKKNQLKLMQWIQSQACHVVEFDNSHNEFDNINTSENLATLNNHTLR